MQRSDRSRWQRGLQWTRLSQGLVRLRAPKSEAKWLLATSYSISVWMPYQQFYQH